MRITLTCLALGLISLTHLRAQPEGKDQLEIDKLAANAKSFVEFYNGGDSASIAKSFLPTGEIVLANGEVVAGREEISSFYEEILSGEDRPQAALEAGSVRFVTPGIAIEDGTFHVTSPSGEVTSHHYTAVQVKQENGDWLTASIRDEIEDHAPASEKLIALEWMVGDWLIEKEGSRTFLSFSWSDDGPYIDGKALTEIAGQESTSSTYRIGWNSKRRNFVSWAFDALGGYSKSDWTTTDNGWLLRSSGVTADGEINRSTESLVPSEDSENFLWSSRDQTIGDEKET
jgi:uncharacterized protein (TIGR02246 family)